METALRWLGTWFGLGRAPVAPGTFGTLGALPLVWAFARFGDLPYMILTFVFVVASIQVAHFYETLIAHEHDVPEFVMDEVAGFLVAMTWLPMQWPWLLAAFALFRLFDALKPWPISWVDRRVLGGVGIVADDLVAGIVTNVILQAVYQHGF